MANIDSRGAIGVYKLGRAMAARVAATAVSAPKLPCRYPLLALENVLVSTLSHIRSIFYRTGQLMSVSTDHGEQYFGRYQGVPDEIS